MVDFFVKIVFCLPIIFFLLVFLFIVFVTLRKNNKIMQLISNFLFKFVYWVCIIFLAFFIPILFLKGVIGIYNTIIFIIGINVVWNVIPLLIRYKSYIFGLFDVKKVVYVRDVNVLYSPAVLSYFVDGEIKREKALSATLLNLCANKVIKINKDGNGKLAIVDLKNYSKIDNLTLDEKYAYEMFVNGVNDYRISLWEKRVKEEFYKLKFTSFQRTFDIDKCAKGMIFSFFIMLFLLSYNYAMAIILFFLFWEIFFANTFRSKYINRNGKTEIFTSLGVEEKYKWKKFKKFIKDFTLVKERKYDSVVLLGKYLSYSIALGINKECDSELYKMINIEYSFDDNTFLNIFNNF